MSMMKSLISFRNLRVEKAAVRFNGTGKELGQWGGGQRQDPYDPTGWRCKVPQKAIFSFLLTIIEVKGTHRNCTGF